MLRLLWFYFQKDVLGLRHADASPDPRQGWGGGGQEGSQRRRVEARRDKAAAKHGAFSSQHCATEDVAQGAARACGRLVGVWQPRRDVIVTSGDAAMPAPAS